MGISESLRFVRGAIARKNYDAALTHFRLSDGFVRSYNGIIALCSPIPLDFTALPKAVPFIKAIQSCEDAVSLHLTPAGKLAIRSGGFRAYIECLEDADYPDVKPEGERIAIAGHDFLGALKAVERFIGEDASRPWARGVLFRGQSVYATNNIVLLEHWLPTVFPIEVNVPQEAVSELLRVGEAPAYLWTSDTSVTFEYEDGRWLRSRLYATTWPDVARVLERESAQEPFPGDFFTTLEKLVSFVDKQSIVYFNEGQATTSLAEGEGAGVDLHVHNKAAFNIHQLLQLQGIAQTIDFSQYPSPCMFYGTNLRGAIAGIRT